LTQPFDDTELRAAYGPRLRELRTTHGPECPSPDALLAAIQGEGAESVRLQILDTAMQCGACRRDLALLHAVSGGSTRAAQVAARRFGWQRFAPLAAAASILLLVGLFGVNQWRQRTQENTMRAANTREVSLISPANASSHGEGSVTFVWHPVAGALRYTLEVDAADGSVLFSAATTDTILAAPLDNVIRGAHRWMVRAQMDDGSERRSEIRVLGLK
jgi:hypothetical protein